MIIFAFLFPLLLSTTTNGEDLNVSKFVRDPMMGMCDLSVRIDFGCSKVVENSRSLLDCAKRCVMETECIGVSIDENETCFIHNDCPLISGCMVSNTNHKLFTLKAEDALACSQGTWNSFTQSCVCADGFHGENCDKRFALCNNLIAAGYAKGSYRVLLDPDQDGKDPFPANCWVDPGTARATATILRNRGEEDFNRTWDNYVHGFHYNDAHTWIGLQGWHELSLVGCRTLSFQFTLQKEGYPSVLRSYSQFFLDNSVAGFNIYYSFSSNSSFGEFPSGSYFGDCLAGQQGVPFSTWDNDNDNDNNENCAQRAGSGWWYYGCDNPCNALGYGLPFWNDKPSHELFSLAGLDMGLVSNETGTFAMNLDC